MRSEKEMFDLLLGTAKSDERILAVYMNGSRANTNVKKDIFQDYDIVYVVKETASFLADKNWIGRFGTILIMQEPDLMDSLRGEKMDFSHSYTYLMQFDDGNRIDLHLQCADCMEDYGSDSLTVPLLDKCGILPALGEPSDSDYHVKAPGFYEYQACCNEFWWVTPYCAKGLWRNEALYACEQFSLYCRSQLLLMLSWRVGFETGFSLSLGKSYKYLDSFLSQPAREKLYMTYSLGTPAAICAAILSACGLFDETASFVAASLGFDYNLEEAQNSRRYIECVLALPRDAFEIF